MEKSGLPYDIREFIKRAAHDVLRHKVDAEDNGPSRQQEIAKRTVAFEYWARAISNGIPENEFEPSKAAILAFVDATIAGDEEQREEASDALARWRQYG